MANSNLAPVVGSVDSDSYTFDLSTDLNKGSFTGGIVKLFRVGKQVTIHAQGALTHASANSILSGAIIPAAFRPSGTVSVASDYYQAGTTLFRVLISTAGVIEIDYINSSTGGTVNRTDSGAAFSVPYIIP